ncbi:MAG: ABC transporter substrate-binding protein, partial [Anaerolineae bacterium]
MSQKLFSLVSAVVVLAMLLTACAAPTPQVVEKVVEKPVVQTQVVEKVVEKPVEKVVEKPVVVTPTPAPTTAPDVRALPRQETLYFNGFQWGPVVCWNPYSSSCNNAMAISQGDNARVTMFETPYLYNMLDGKQYPLLADGDYQWNATRTELTFKLKKAAKWSDGTPVTAEDVAYTWATHVKYNTAVGAANKGYIETIEAKDPQTVVVKAKVDANGKALNPLIVAAYVSSNYVLQKAWTQKLEQRTGGDATKLMA